MAETEMATLLWRPVRRVCLNTPGKDYERSEPRRYANGFKDLWERLRIVQIECFTVLLTWLLIWLQPVRYECSDTQRSEGKFCEMVYIFGVSVRPPFLVTTSNQSLVIVLSRVCGTYNRKRFGLGWQA